MYDIAPTLCVFHADCPDGFASAVAVYEKFGDSVEFCPSSYGQLPPDVRGHHVVIVDFSYPAEVLRKISTLAASVTVLDHHKTAASDLLPLLEDGTISGIFDMDKSGAVITWEYYHDTMVPELLLYIQDNDLWKFELIFSKSIYAWISTQPHQLDVWSDITHSFENMTVTERDVIVGEGQAILRRHFFDVELSVRTTLRYMVIGGIRVPVINCPRTIASDAAELTGNMPFSASYVDRTHGRQFNLRSGLSGVDVSEIARLYGGGGHRHAAGFNIPFHLLVEMELL